MTTDALLRDLEAHREALTRLLDGLPADAVHARPSPGAWSLAQVAEHLALIDAGLRLGGPKLSAAGRATSPARAAALRAVFALPIRIPAPPGAEAVMPSESPSWPEVRARWAATRAGWRGAPARSAGRVAYDHPLLGPFRLRDALAFLRAHHRHHDAQVRRTLERVMGDEKRVTGGTQTRDASRPAPGTPSGRGGRSLSTEGGAATPPVTHRS